MSTIRLKRAYEEPGPDDGVRIFVERLWPRGVRKEDARLDLWLKDIAPSPELRKWYGHDPARWKAFRDRYRRELQDHPEAVAALREKLTGPVTFVYAARDTERNSAAVLRAFLDQG